MNWHVKGYSEAGLNVRDMQSWINFFCDVGCWEVVFKGSSPPSTFSNWPIEQQEGVKECLLQAPEATGGRIRLFQFDGPEQIEIRGDSRTWDSGGIFDLDFRVPDVHHFSGVFEQLGWTGVSQPIDWPFGELSVREWLTTGPENVVFALIQRLHPPLPDAQPLSGLGPAFNSSQIVADMPRARKFYEALGFQVMVEHSGPLDGPGGEVLGLSAEDAPNTPVELLILHPDKIMDGSIELVSFPNTRGKDLADRGLPHNLGLNLLRFEVCNINSFRQHLQSTLPALQTALCHTRLEPYGDIELLSLQSPDGAWLEFYEKSS